MEEERQVREQQGEDEKRRPRGRTLLRRCVSAFFAMGIAVGLIAGVGASGAAGAASPFPAAANDAFAADAARTGLPAELRVELGGVSAQACLVGQELRVSPAAVAGVDAASISVSYSWAYRESPDAAQSSITRDAGAYTAADAWSFTPLHAGEYTLYADMSDAAGNVALVSATVSVDEQWSFDSLEASTSTVRQGVAATFAPRVSGESAAYVRYDYAWARDGEPDFHSSTREETGWTTDATSWSFTPTKPGTYTITVTAVGTGGQEKSLSRKLVVTLPYEAKGVALSAESVGVGDSVVATPQVEGDVSTARFAYTWRLLDSKGSASGSIVESGSVSGSEADTSWTFTPGKWGAYRLSLDVIAADGSKQTFTADFEVERGWEAPALSVDHASPQTVGTEMAVSCAATGAKASFVRYDWRWTRGDGASWAASEEAGTFTSNTTWNFMPRHSGDYTLECVLYDTRTDQSVTVSAPMRVNKAWSLDGLSLSYDSPLRPGALVWTTANVSGDASGLVYDFGWQRDGWAESNSNSALGGAISANSDYWHIGSSGWYTFFVTVTDQWGESDYREVSGIRGFSPSDAIDTIVNKLAGEPMYQYGVGWKYENALLAAGGSLCNNSHGYWCANFIWWGFWETGFSDLWGTWGKQADPEWLANEYISMGRFQTGTVGIQRGDILFAYWNAWRPNQWITHAAYVVDVSDNYITVIEGNMPDRIIWGDYYRWGPTAVGYARPAY